MPTLRIFHLTIANNIYTKVSVILKQAYGKNKNMTKTNYKIFLLHFIDPRIKIFFFSQAALRI